MYVLSSKMSNITLKFCNNLAISSSEKENLLSNILLKKFISRLSDISQKKTLVVSTVNKVGAPISVRISNYSH
jgi:hypothetical protein